MANEYNPPADWRPQHCGTLTMPILDDITEDCFNNTVISFGIQHSIVLDCETREVIDND